MCLCMGIGVCVSVCRGEFMFTQTPSCACAVCVCAMGVCALCVCVLCVCVSCVCVLCVVSLFLLYSFSRRDTR